MNFKGTGTRGSNEVLGLIEEILNIFPKISKSDSIDPDARQKIFVEKYVQLPELNKSKIMITIPKTLSKDIANSVLAGERPSLIEIIDTHGKNANLGL